MAKVLVVDDSAFMRLTLRMMLERKGFEVVGEAANGALGVRRYEELRPDLVTMDMTMPEMDGLRALQAIKQLDPAAKVVVVSAMGQETMVRDAIMAGAKSFIVKPFAEEHVVATLNKILGN